MLGSRWQVGIDEGFDQGKLVFAQMPDEGVAHRGGVAGFEPSVVQQQADLPGQRFARGGGDDITAQAEREQAEEQERQRELVANRYPFFF